MRGLVAQIILIAVVTALEIRCGGATDVGNPPGNAVVGKVTEQFSDGPVAAGARVVLSKRGADPGFGQSEDCSRSGDIGICSEPIFFDTTYTDADGSFIFQEVYPGSYVLVASYSNLLSLEYIDQRAFQDAQVAMVVSEPATVYLKNYSSIDSAKPFFRAARIAGTGFLDSIDEAGEIVLKNVPAAELDLILYRSDNTTKFFPALQTDPGCQAELYSLPDLSVDYWTPHPCGYRDPLGRPYVLESAVRSNSGDTAEFLMDGKPFDISITFSHAMDARSTGEAIHGFSDDGSTTIASLWWEGATTLYISLCVKDDGDECRSTDYRFKQGVTYGVTIDTTARTALGVSFAHDAYIRFVPDR